MKAHAMQFYNWKDLFHDIFIGVLAIQFFGTFLEDADGCDAEKGTSRK